MRDNEDKPLEDTKNKIAYWSLIISICAMIGTLSQAVLNWNMRHSTVETALLSERIKFCGELQSMNSLISHAFISAFHETRQSTEERQARSNKGLADWKIDLLNISIRLDKLINQALLIFPKNYHVKFTDLRDAFKRTRDNIEINEYKIQNLAYDGYARIWFSSSGEATETCSNASAMTSASPFR